MINVNHQDIINIIQMPKEVISVVHTEITQTFELYVFCSALVEGQIGYKMFYCDLEVFTYQDTLEK